jgi:hypothetical protein
MECANSSGEVIVNFDASGVWTMFPDDDAPVLRYTSIAKRPDWPKELHREYLNALDERDAAIEEADRYKRIIEALLTNTKAGE